MSTSQLWGEYYRAWSQLTPPLRPNHEVVSGVKALIGQTPGRTLLLGVTPELADIAEDVIAIDRNYSMVTNIWPGNTRGRRVVVGDWLRPNFAADSFALCVGDGSINALECPNEVMLLCRELARVLQNGGRIVSRILTAPDHGETIAEVKDAAVRGKIRNFHAFKCRLGAAIVGEGSSPNVKLRTILGVFNELFADRDRLAHLTGWRREQIDTIDFYGASQAAMSFPTQNQLFLVLSESFSNVRFVPVGTYELAERCPLLVAKKL